VFGIPDRCNCHLGIQAGPMHGSKRAPSDPRNRNPRKEGGVRDSSLCLTGEELSFCAL